MINQEYKRLLNTVLQGSESCPRSMKVKEVLGYQSWVPMDSPIVTCVERNISLKFLFAEAAWILSGDNKVSTIAPFNSNISPYSDDGIRYYGAYGPKVMDQISYVVEKLVSDRDSRQAVINIWRENPPVTKDVPCTLSLQFLLRHGCIHCVATMRSSDAWLGWVYDVFNFSMIARAVAIEYTSRTGRPLHLGKLCLTAGSQHLYEQHWDKAKQLINGEETIHVNASIDYRDYKSVEHFVEGLWIQAEARKAQPR